MGFQKLVGYGCTAFWNVSGNTAGAVLGLTFCMKKGYSKYLIDMDWKHQIKYTLNVFCTKCSLEFIFMKDNVNDVLFADHAFSFKVALIVLAHAKLA